MGKDPTRSYRPTHRQYVGIDKSKRHDPIKKKSRKGKSINQLPMQRMHKTKTSNTTLQVTVGVKV